MPSLLIIANPRILGAPAGVSPWRGLAAGFRANGVQVRLAAADLDPGHAVQLTDEAGAGVAAGQIMAADVVCCDADVTPTTFRWLRERLRAGRPIVLGARPWPARGPLNAHSALAHEHRVLRQADVHHALIGPVLEVVSWCDVPGRVARHLGLDPSTLLSPPATRTLTAPTSRRGFAIAGPTAAGDDALLANARRLAEELDAARVEWDRAEGDEEDGPNEARIRDEAWRRELNATCEGLRQAIVRASQHDVPRMVALADGLVELLLAGHWTRIQEPAGAGATLALLLLHGSDEALMALGRDRLHALWGPDPDPNRIGGCLVLAAYRAPALWDLCVRGEWTPHRALWRTRGAESLVRVEWEWGLHVDRTWQGRFLAADTELAAALSDIEPLADPLVPGDLMPHALSHVVTWLAGARQYGLPQFVEQCVGRLPGRLWRKGSVLEAITAAIAVSPPRTAEEMARWDDVVRAPLPRVLTRAIVGGMLVWPSVSDHVGREILRADLPVYGGFRLEELIAWRLPDGALRRELTAGAPPAPPAPVRR